MEDQLKGKYPKAFEDTEAVFISPHLDDFVFSSLNLVTLFKNIYIINIFSYSNWTVRTPYGAPMVVTELRKQEDSYVMKLLRRRYKVNIYSIYLDFPDANLYTSRIQLKRGEKIPNEFQYIAEQIAKLIVNRFKDFLRENKPLFIPLGVGLHKDHLLSRLIGSKIIKSSRMIPIYWLDYGYKDSLKDIRFNVKDDNICLPWDKIEVVRIRHISVGSKLKYASLYKSQINRKLLNLIAKTYEVQEGELYITQ